MHETYRQLFEMSLRRPLSRTPVLAPLVANTQERALRATPLGVSKNYKSSANWSQHVGSDEGGLCRSPRTCLEELSVVSFS